MKNDGRWSTVMSTLDHMELDWACRLSFRREIEGIEYDFALEDHDSYWQVTARFPKAVSKDDLTWFPDRLRNLSHEAGCGVFELTRERVPLLRVTTLHDAKNAPPDDIEVEHLLRRVFDLLAAYGGRVVAPPYGWIDWFRDALRSLTRRLRTSAGPESK